MESTDRRSFIGSFLAFVGLAGIHPNLCNNKQCLESTDSVLLPIKRIIRRPNLPADVAIVVFQWKPRIELACTTSHRLLSDDYCWKSVLSFKKNDKVWLHMNQLFADGLLYCGK